MPTDTGRSAPPTLGSHEPGPRERDALEHVAAEDLIISPAEAWMMIELGRQGDVLDRLTALLPAAEQAARLMNNRAAAAVAGLAGRRGGRNGRAAASIDLKGT